MILGYMLSFDVDPLMFHQANLRAHDGAQSLLTGLIDRVLTRYDAVIGNLPICCLSQREIGQQMAQRAAYNAATIQANLVYGIGLVLNADRDVIVPLTGVSAEGNGELYGGQYLSLIPLESEAMHWIPLAELVGYEPVKSHTSTN
jgi:hypothetical protein